MKYRKDISKGFYGKLRFLSNFDKSPLEFKIEFREFNKELFDRLEKIIKFDGKIYPSSEHLYQSLKTNILEEKEWFLEEKNKEPKRAKYLGRKITMRDDWEDIKIDIMEMTTILKYTQHPNLAQKLMGMRDEDLIEWNYWKDEFWGVNIHTGEGRNELGKALKRVKYRLKDIHSGL